MGGWFRKEVKEVADFNGLHREDDGRGQGPGRVQVAAVCRGELSRTERILLLPDDVLGHVEEFGRDFLPLDCSDARPVELARELDDALVVLAREIHDPYSCHAATVAAAGTDFTVFLLTILWM
jgi:hypothetical protein